jgi:hypothetical protein
MFLGGGFGGSTINKLTRVADRLAPAGAPFLSGHHGGDMRERSPSTCWLRSAAPQGFLEATHAMFKWSSSSTAPSRLDAVSSSTSIAEGRLLQVSFRCQIFNLQARVPYRRHCCFTMVFSICINPSGSVPSTGVGDHALKLHCIDGGQGPNCIFQS